VHRRANFFLNQKSEIRNQKLGIRNPTIVF
jgi:hypothetical protein